MNWLAKAFFFLVLGCWMLTGDAVPTASAETSRPFAGQEMVVKKHKKKHKGKKKHKKKRANAEQSESQVA
jgi:hypothetical protein